VFGGGGGGAKEENIEGRYSTPNADAQYLKEIDLGDGKQHRQVSAATSG
jgi:hypothetical protein